MQPIIETRSLTKMYGSVAALEGTDFTLYPGEVVAIVGDNGAGKSTLIRCLIGAEQPTSGDMFLNGQPLAFARPIDSRIAGIETVGQVLPKDPPMDISTNLFVGREVRKPGPLGGILRMVMHNGIVQRTKRHVPAIGGSASLHVASTTDGRRRVDAVVRAASVGSTAVILDEPTASLDRSDAAEVLKLIRRMRDRGIPVIVVSHNLREMFEVADRIHVQRLGRRAAVVAAHTVTVPDVVAIMSGELQVVETDQSLGPVR